MISNIKRLCIALVFAILAPFQVAADEVTDVVNDVAAKLVQQLPMDKKIALKSLSPDETGLPEDFLRKLTSDFEAALLTASNFEIKLLNRDATEEIWGDAIEFGDSKFEELYQASEASTLILLSPRVLPVGLEINASAYELKGDSSGMLIASTGNQKIAVDLQKLLGVNINTIDDNIQKILAELDTLSKSTQRIKNPKTYSDFIHNARYSERNNQNIEAIRSYAAATEVNSKFVDPYLKISQLSNFQFGSDNAVKFIRSQLTQLTSSDFLIIDLALGNPKISNFDILQKKIVDPVLLSLWLNIKFRETIPNYSECSRLFFNGQLPCSSQESFVGDVSEALAIRVAIDTIVSASKAGYFSQVFLDPRLQIEYVKEDQYSQFSLTSQDHFNMLKLVQNIINSAEDKETMEDNAEFQLKIFSPIIDRFPNYMLTQYAGTKPFYEDGENIEFAIALAANLARVGYDAASAKMLDAVNNHLLQLKSFYPYDNQLNPDSDGGCKLINKLQNLKEVSSWVGQTQYDKALDLNSLGKRWSIRKRPEECENSKTHVSDYSDYLENFYKFTTSDAGGEAAILATRQDLLNIIAKKPFDQKALLEKLDQIVPNGSHRYSSYRSLTEAFIIPKLVREGQRKLANQFVLNILTREDFGTYPKAVMVSNKEAIALALTGYVYSINEPEDFTSIKGKSVISNNKKFQKTTNVMDGLSNVFRTSCGMGYCFWTEILQSSSLESNSGGGNNYEIIKVQYRGGQSGPHTDDYSDNPQQAKIDWGNKSDIVVYCHNRYPAITDLQGREGNETLGVVSPYGFESDKVSIYLKVCHDFKADSNTSSEDFLKDLGYIDSERVPFTTKDDWMCLHSNQSSCTKRGSSLACFIPGSKARVVNVKKFTNLRQQAGLGGRIIGQVPLGAQVSIVSPGDFLRYDRCAAACNGGNQQSIKACIDNNDVWIEVQIGSHRGFLSRKFLE